MVSVVEVRIDSTAFVVPASRVRIDHDDVVQCTQRIVASLAKARGASTTPMEDEVNSALV